MKKLFIYSILVLFIVTSSAGFSSAATSEFGLAFGSFGSARGTIVELRRNDPFNVAATTVRFGAGYVLGEDTDHIMRHHYLLVLDGIYRLQPPQRQGVRSYFGAGLNFDLLTSDNRSGSLGGQFYWGGEVTFARGTLFLEAGYGLIRTGYSAPTRGMNLLFGYRL
ncbi:MAG: hypothetical protein PHH14_06345 [Candidatus Margulisbacteria bacterium]|nr:hypothetical protein [Candidatus Margulisiibacteriota bacterium]